MNSLPIVQFRRESPSDVGFTLLEVLLVVTISSILCVGFLSFCIDAMKLYYALTARSEVSHQLMTGVEAVCTGLQSTDPSSIQLMEDVGEAGYSQIQFKRYNSSDLYWFYLNPEGKLIQAVKRPNEDWGRNSVAEGIEGLYFSQIGSMTGVPLLRLTVRGQSGGHPLAFSTNISPGFL